MPIFEIEDPTTGRIVELEGDSPPTEQELEQIFSQLPTLGQAPEGEVIEQPGFLEEKGRQALGGAEALLSLATGAGAEALSGIPGIAKTITTGPEAGEETIRGIQEALTFQPRTEAGKETITGVGDFFQKVVEFSDRNKLPIITPIIEAFQGKLGDAVFEKTGSPTLAALTNTAPVAAIEILGAKGAGKIAKQTGLKKAAKFEKSIDNAIQQSISSAEELKQTARGVFKEIKDTGATVKPGAMQRFTVDVEQGLIDGGFRPNINTDVAKVLDEIKAKSGQITSVDDLEGVRKVAQGLANNLDPQTSALGNSIIRNIDDMLGAADVLDFPKGSPKNLGESYRSARQFWKQARIGETLTKADELAKINPAGYLQGIQTEYRKLMREFIKKKGSGRFFSKEDFKLMNDLVEGKKGTNILKTLSKLKASRAGGGNLTPLIGPGAGLISGIATGDISVGLTGLILPFIGEVSDTLVSKLAKNNAKLANDLLRAGNRGRKIARAYFEGVPSKLRTTEDLAELLQNPAIDLSTIPKTRFTEEALKKAEQLRKAGTFAKAQIVISAPQRDEQ